MSFAALPRRGHRRPPIAEPILKHAGHPLLSYRRPASPNRHERRRINSRSKQTTETATTPIEPATTDDDLRALVTPDPVKSGRAFWRLVPSERPIWAIIMHLLTLVDGDDPTEATDDQIQQTADDYAISEVEVRAALAYYAKYRKFIDAVILLNSDSDDEE